MMPFNCTHNIDSKPVMPYIVDEAAVMTHYQHAYRGADVLPDTHMNLGTPASHLS
jgi:hypothetical protein